MAHVRYIFGDLRSGLVTSEIALQGVTLDNKLNGVGNMGATMQLDQSGQQNSDLINATIPGKSFVVVERDDVPIWDGIVWTRTYQAQSKTMQLSMRTREGYLESVLVDADMGYTDIEQRNIMVGIFNTLQSDPNRNLGITVPPATYPDAVLRTVSVLATEYKTFYSVISSIADGVNGFDWNLETQRVGDAYLRSLRIGYPYLGSTAAGALTFDYPGSITNYYETEGMSDAGTKVYLLGSGEGSGMVVGIGENLDMYANGWLRFDETYSRKDITDLAAAQDLVNQQMQLRRPPMATLKIFVKADLEPVFGSYGLGDTATISIRDARHPYPGITFVTRMVAFDYRPPSDDNIESAELIFQGDELNEG
jgi:hypothetical protein